MKTASKLFCFLGVYVQAVLAAHIRTSGFGIYENVAAQVDKTHGALRVSLRPAEKGVYGSYSQQFNGNAFAAGAVNSAVILACRWTATTANMLLRRVSGALPVSTAFAQGDIALDLIRATKASAQYTGGQNVTFTGKDGARSTRMAASQMAPINAAATGNIAVSSGVALTAPGVVWTFDSNPLGRAEGQVLTGMQTTVIWEAPEYRDPLEVQNGEGFVVRATWPATGVVTGPIINLEWDEVDPARYFGNF